MKTSDEQRNEDLRRWLSPMFTRFGREPSPDVWHRIQAGIPRRSPWMTQRWLRLVAVLVLVGVPLNNPVMVQWPSGSGLDATRSRRLSTRSVVPKGQPGRFPSRPSSGPRSGLSAPDVFVENNDVSRLSSAIPKTPRKPTASMTRTASTILGVGQSVPDSSRRAVSPSAAPEGGKPDRGVTPFVAGDYRPDKSALGRPTAWPAPTRSLWGDRLPIRRLTFPPIASWLTRPVEWPMTVPAIRPLSRPTNWQLAGDLTPLSTYQLITTRNVPETYVQHIQAPSPLSRQALGFKLGLGLAKGDWKAQLILTRMKRWASYEIATDEYRVVPIDQTSSLVIRAGVPVTESTTVTMMGLRLVRSQSWFVGPRLRLVTSVGAEGHWSLPTQQAVFFLQGGVGIGYQLSPQSELRIAPTAEFGLFHWQDSNQLLAIQPYTVGIQIGLKRSIGIR